MMRSMGTDDRIELKARVRAFADAMGGARTAAPLLRTSYNAVVAFLAGEKTREATIALMEKYIDEAETKAAARDT